jgi:predicted transcriptional regulator
MSMISMRLPDELSNQLNILAVATGRTKSFLAGQAIRDYIERESWQIAEITQAINEADAGDFASEEEVYAISAKWERNAG